MFMLQHWVTLETEEYKCANVQACGRLCT